MIQDPQTIEAPSKPKIAKATVLALLVAAVILVTAVLPAEYGIDPIGTGAALGLADLSQKKQGALAPQSREYKLDSTEFRLGPREWVEYKYRLEEGGSMVYSWKATGKVIYDMHSEPDGAARGYAESFEKSEKDQASGTYIAPFPGIHGWYWENPGQQELTIKLMTAGFYSAAQTFREGADGIKTFQ